MRKLSQNTRSILENDERMKKCCLADYSCSGRIEWHHNLIYGGRQSDIPETILPVCQSHHDAARSVETKEKLDLIMLHLLSDEQIKQISKAVDYFKRKKYLREKHSNQDTNSFGK